jgi:hypothetical protein
VLKFPSSVQANKDTIENKDILTLLSWAESHKTVMQRFGVQQFSEDFRTLEVDLVKVRRALHARPTCVFEISHVLGFLQRYSTQVQALQRQWMQRIHDLDVEAAVQTLAESVITNWPEDLANCLRQQLKVALQLPGEVGANVCCTCLSLLQEFRTTQNQWLNASSTTLTIERMCAYSNNHHRFANILTDLQPDICDEVDAYVSVLSQPANSAILISFVLCTDTTGTGRRRFTTRSTTPSRSSPRNPRAVFHTS